jgi:hypothetical protein
MAAQEVAVATVETLEDLVHLVKVMLVVHPIPTPALPVAVVLDKLAQAQVIQTQLPVARVEMV